MTLFIDQSIAHRLEAAQAWRMVTYSRAIKSLHPDIKTGVEAVAGGYAVFTGGQFPVNRTLAIGLAGAISSTDLDRIEQFYARFNLPARIDCCPLADPLLLKLLVERGYQAERFFSVLAWPLMDETVPVDLARDVRISRAEPEQAELWLMMTAQGFDATETPSQGTLDILAPNFYSDNATAYFAWIDDQPAGGGAMFIYEGVVEVGGASTRPTFRRRGVQTALLYSRLADARQQGCDLAVVMTEPGTTSQRNMERVGFRLAYTKLVMVGA